MRLEPHTQMCSACFCQKPDVEAVDFQAAWDGGSLKGRDAAGEPLPLAAGSSNMAIDDLVLCADCIRGAAALLTPLPPDPVAAAEAETEAERVAALDGRVEELQRYVARLEGAVQAKPGGKAPRPPRPQ
jgi:hypothetical protein